MVLIDMEIPSSCRDCGFRVNCDECEGWEQYCCLVGNIGYDILTDKRRDDCPLKELKQSEPQITTNIYDKEEIFRGCIVQVLRNSVTGDVSVGWWKEENDGNKTTN